MLRRVRTRADEIVLVLVIIAGFVLSMRGHLVVGIALTGAAIGGLCSRVVVHQLNRRAGRGRTRS